MEDVKSKIYYGSDINLTGSITDKLDIIQTFTADSDTLYEIGINFATYKYQNVDAIIQISVLNLEGKELYNNSFTNGLFKDNKFLVIRLNLSLTLKERYVLRITGEKKQIRKPVTAKWGQRQHPKELFCINSVPKHGELYCYFSFQPPKIIHPTINQSFISGLISVVIPVFNSSEYLSGLLDSLKKQTYNYLQIIIVDDGSKDVKEVKNICNKYVDDLNILFIDLRNNYGAPKARNMGFKHVRGEFTFFCDSDVILNKNIFQEMIQSLHVNSKAVWTYCNFTWGSNKLVFHPFDKNKLLKNNLSSTMSMLRSNTFLLFDENLNKYQDWDLWLRYAKQGNFGVWINKFLFHAIERDGITSKYTRREGLVELRKNHPLAGR